jgi:hypothetical protein
VKNEPAAGNTSRSLPSYCPTGIVRMHSRECETVMRNSKPESKMHEQIHQEALQ